MPVGGKLLLSSTLGSQGQQRVVCVQQAANNELLAKKWKAGALMAVESAPNRVHLTSLSVEGSAVLSCKGPHWPQTPQ